MPSRFAITALVAGPRPGSSRTLALLFLAGLALRLPGLFVNANPDVFQIILDWGFDVRALGLARAFGINYGVLSYAVFGVAADLGAEMPRFWWLPYKAAILVFDTAVLVALWRLVSPGARGLVTGLYWLNPWFIVHGAYQGFWEGPYLLFGVLAVLSLGQRGSTGRGWFVCGLLLMTSGMFKPQGLIHFVGPLGLFLGLEWLRGRTRPLQAFTGGLTLVALVLTLGIVAGGGSPLALARNIESSGTTMPNLSNGGPNLWRFVSFAGMEWLGQSGPVTDFRPGRAWVAALSLVSGLVCLAVFLAFGRRLTLREPPIGVARRWLSGLVQRLSTTLTPSSVGAATAALLFLVIGGLVMSQFGVRAHINHSYGASVLLVPLVVTNRRLLPWWVGFVTIQAAAHLATYGIGTPLLLPPESAFVAYPHAVDLIDQIRTLPAYTRPGTILVLQTSVNAWLSQSISPTAVAVLSLGTCACAVGLLRELVAGLSPRAASPVQG